MRKFRIGFLVILIVIVSLCAFSACNKREEDELIVWWPSGKVMSDIMNDALNEYKAQNPNAKIKIVNKPIDAFDAYRYALNDPKTCPDLAILDHVYVQALAHDGLLQSMTELGSDDIKALYPEMVYNANTYNGRAYALPFSANTVVLMFNKDILKKCGIVDKTGNAKAPTTLDELIADCEIIKSKGYTAFAQPQNSFSAMEFASYVARRGGKLVSDDYKTPYINSAEVKQAAEDWRALSKFASSKSYEEDKFYTGQVAFVEMGSWALSKVTGQSARFDLGVSEIVTIKSGIPNYSGLGLYSLCISNSSKLKKEAYDFAKFLSTNKKVQIAYNKAQNLFPVCKEALNDEYYTSSPILSVYASQLEKVAPRPGTPAWPDMEQAIVNMLVEIVRNDGDSTPILDKYQALVAEATDRLF